MNLTKNDYITYLLVLVIIISLGFIGINFTGYVTDTAFLNVTVTSTANINFTSANITFESGIVTGGKSFAYLDTEGNIVDGSWGVVSSGFVLENIGNVNVTLNITSSNDADGFIGGSSPAYRYKISDVETSSCTGGGASSYIPLNETGPVLACAIFSYHNTYDSINLDINLTIPNDATLGELNSTIIAIGTAI
ncbi:hypothetical protein HN604_02215 [archaeon]|jgi:hypothetical protein|nr:hypothetical protein [archaeon]MBT6182875.1 hypothetical protein [archaeon]MBT6606258.1 hypothetical protein [archaeon]MBT7251573.1 hypothetical protein [archaeon]MBT7660876.1 hypothetical protein [archaeon]